MDGDLVDLAQRQRGEQAIYSRANHSVLYIGTDPANVASLGRFRAEVALTAKRRTVACPSRIMAVIGGWLVSL